MIRVSLICLLTALAAAQAVAGPGQTGSGGGSDDGSDAGSGSSTDTGSGGGSDQPKADPKKTFDDLGEKTSDFDKLKTPASPAFTLLGVAPTEIQRPSTPKAVAISLGQFVSGTSLVVPKNFALEVSPYWLFHHPDLTLQQYQDEAGMRPIRTFAISIATSQTTRTEVDSMGTSTDQTDSDVALGARSMLYQSEFSKACLDTVAPYVEAMNITVHLDKADIAKLDSQYKRGSDEWNKAAADLQQKKLDDAKNGAKKDLLTTPKCISDGTLVRGWTVDAAAAIDVLAKDSKLTTEATSWHRAGAWLNAAYDVAEWSAAAMVRFAAENDTTTQKVVDAGARGFYKGKTYAVSAEMLVRYRLDADTDTTTYKADVAAEYELTDSTWLAVSFGKDFAFTPGNVGSLFTLANLQWNLGTPQINK